MKRVIGNLTTNITDLVELFPQIQESQMQLAAKDATALAKQQPSELVQPSEIEEPEEEWKAAVAALQEAASDVDTVFAEAVKKEAEKSGDGPDYGKINVKDRARANVGDYFAPGQERKRATGPRAKYGVMIADNNARVQVGDVYGGKSLWDD